MLPIASLTKMMTALVVVERVPPGSKVRITKEALRYQGSGVGLLPRGKWIGVNTMLYGLMLPSGNDAAIALAQRAAGGSVKRFVRYMNEKAEAARAASARASRRRAGSRTRATTRARPTSRRSPAPCCASRGWRGSCASAAGGPAVPDQGRAAVPLQPQPAAARRATRGTTGLKTGYTDAAGRCLVATARRGPIKLGVVLLDSPGPRQAGDAAAGPGLQGLSCAVNG